MSRFKAAEGDWVCSKEDCENVNFAKRDKCNKCGRAKGESYIVKKEGSEIGSKFAEKSKGLFSADDWQCTKCGNINWARRTTCNVCNAPKVGPDEQRTGYGGGFKENSNIVYDRKEDSDSDGEFDIYGRRKKRFRGQSSKETDTKEEDAMVEDTKVIEDDKDNKEGVKDDKDDFDDDDDDDDDEDDDDVDLSKYNLDSDEDDDDVPPPVRKIFKRSNPPSDSASNHHRDRSRSPISNK